MSFYVIGLVQEMCASPRALVVDQKSLLGLFVCLFTIKHVECYNKVMKMDSYENNKKIKNSIG